MATTAKPKRAEAILAQLRAYLVNAAGGNDEASSVKLVDELGELTGLKPDPELFDDYRQGRK